MKPVNRPQLSKIHVLLNQFGILDDKAELVRQFTNGRETSSTQLTFNEARALITHLSKFDPLDKMRKKVFALAFSTGIIYGDSPDDRKMNVAKLNMFLRERGAVKKELNKLSKDELVKVVNQFSAMTKNIELSQAGKTTKSMLNDIGITTK